MICPYIRAFQIFGVSSRDINTNTSIRFLSTASFISMLKLIVIFLRVQCSELGSVDPHGNRFDCP